MSYLEGNSEKHRGIPTILTHSLRTGRRKLTCLPLRLKHRGFLRGRLNPRTHTGSFICQTLALRSGLFSSTQRYAIKMHKYSFKQCLFLDFFATTWSPKSHFNQVSMNTYSDTLPIEEETSVKKRCCPALLLKSCQCMAECTIPCKGGDGLDVPQPCQAWLIYHNVIIMAIIFLPVKNMTAARLCDKLRCSAERV